MFAARRGAGRGGRPRWALDRTVVSGDVLFAGSIGRTDLPGGDHDGHAALAARRRAAAARHHARAPGPLRAATTMERERATNPYLQGLTA